MGAIQEIINQGLKTATQAYGTKKIVESVSNQKTEKLTKEGEALQDNKFDIDKKELELNQTERNLSKAETNANSLQEQLNKKKIGAEKRNILQEKYDLAMSKLQELRDLREMQMFEQKNRISRFNKDLEAYNEKVSRSGLFSTKSFPKVDAIEGGNK